MGGTPLRIYIQNMFCFKLDAMSVPEALATTIRILLMFSIVLAHRASGDPRAAPEGSPAARASPTVLSMGGIPPLEGYPPPCSHGCPEVPWGALGCP